MSQALILPLWAGLVPCYASGRQPASVLTVPPCSARPRRTGLAWLKTTNHCSLEGTTCRRTSTKCWHWWRGTATFQMWVTFPFPRRLPLSRCQACHSSPHHPPFSRRRPSLSTSLLRPVFPPPQPWPRRASCHRWRWRPMTCSRLVVGPHSAQAGVTGHRASPFKLPCLPRLSAGPLPTGTSCRKRRSWQRGRQSPSCSVGWMSQKGSSRMPALPASWTITRLWHYQDQASAQSPKTRRTGPWASLE